MTPSFRIFLALVTLASLLAFGVSHAANRTVSWTLPTTNTDGSALQASAITAVTVVWGASATTLTNSRNLAGTATSTVIDLAPGTWYIAARVTANGNQSALSNIATVTIPQPTPNPPVITVTEIVAGMDHAPVFKLTTTGKRSAEPAGFVEVGTACEGNVLFRYRDRPYRRVDASAVKFWNVVPSDRVAAPCA